MQFAFEAMRPDGTTVVDRIEAGARTAAAEQLREQGFIVLRLDERSDVAAAGTAARRTLQSRSISPRDLILLTRQMKMLLEAGAPLVPALLATETQTVKPLMRELLARVRTRVEEGASLAVALEPEAAYFDPVFRTMIGAGEATATLPAVFGRLCGLAQQQQQTRKQVVGALVYPSVLSILLTGVVAVLLFFVVPRFRMLFLNLRSPLPATTKLLFAASEGFKAYWPYAAAAFVAALVALVLLVRLPATRIWWDHFILNVPVVGRVVARLIFARVVRVWAAMLRCHVPLLETIRQSREAIRNAAFLKLVAEVEEAVASGGRVAQALEAARIADPIIVSAVRTGEENGRLSESIDFVSGWVDEDNANLIQQLTRLAEPIVLAVMGLVVGFVALALFVPLFDLATAAG